MSVSSTEGVSPGLLGLGNTASTGSASSKDHDTFLQLLVAQLRYQDPMNPTDSTQLMAQNAQYTALEKMQKVADGVQQLLSLQMSFGAAGMIGRQVSWTDSSGVTKTGIASGVGFGASGPVLSVNGTDVPVASVTSVTSPAGTPAGTSTGTTASTPAGTPSSTSASV